jgi:hypothetical protein
MGAAVSITRLDLTASELRKAASGEKDSAAARRILVLALVLDGVDRKTAAESCGMDRQTLRDWGASLQRRGTGRASQSQIAGSWIKTHGAAASRIGRACRGRSRPCDARCGALAAGRSARRIAAALRCRATRAFGREGSAKLGYRKLSVGPAIQRLTKKPRRHLKKLRRDSHGAAPRPRQKQADRNLVPR